ncbi:hypothetical protein V9T40_014726 [Parthenolecanium corni]|uniref:Transposable element P transposase n=1 Tax=Parthenolecanium corni TaxID=536013 RepID=A0AAN9T3Z2_9HEMI
MKPQYGFQDQVFNVMRKKANHMPMAERRGGLFIDEVKLSPNLKFDEKTLRVTGFVDLGVHTPDHQLNTPGDHALVIIYQPLQGKWFQTVGAFLSKGAAPGDVLHNIILEAIVRLENINFHVDYVTSDGATWNRAMWKYFGVSEDKPSCDHIDDSEDRKLWFISDFPHLIKNLRNWVLKVKEFMTPDGKVELSHWKVLLAINESLGLKLSPFFKLSTSHIYPQYYQKMNVGLAYYFFSDEIGTGMQYYSEFEAGLKDAEPTIKFIKRVGSLIKGMTSKRPKEALWYSEKSQALQNIKEFLHFIKDWKCTSPNQEFLTKNTYEGFCVTLASTLQLLEYLNSKIKYKYLLTTRLSQDNLENFFGMIRSAGGNADHPDPMLFIQIYRLMTTYGLMKPMRGSNVENCGELLDSLMTPSDDTDSSSNENNLTQILEECLTNQGLPEGNNERKDYSGEDVAHYVSGYVAKTTARFTKCDECASLLTEQNKDSIPNKLLKIRDHYGVLTYPSHSLFTLLKTIEDIIMSNVQREHEDDDSDEEVDDPQSEARPAKRVKLSQMNVNYDTFLNILENIKNSHLILIGCADDEHRINLTRRIVQFYSVTRMHFVIKKYNNVKFKQKEMSKEMKKKSKLQ